MSADPQLNDPLESALAGIERYRNEPRFAIENLFVVKDLKARRVMPLRFNEAQVKLQEEIEWFRARARPVRLWICKARRAGISTGCEANIFHDTMFNPGTWSLILANQNKPARNILNMCHVFWENLPAQFKHDLPPEFRNRPGTDSLIFPNIDSRVYIATAKSLEQYLSFGFHNIHGTEVARWEQGDELMVSLYPTLVDENRSMFFGESTPRGQGNFFHEQVMLAAESEGRHGGQWGGFRLLFIPWHVLKLSYSREFETPNERKVFSLSLDDKEKALVAQHDTSMEQLNWRRSKLSGPPFNADEDFFDQEYPSDLETAFLSSGFTVFSRPALKRLVQNKRHALFHGDVYSGEAKSTDRWYDLVRRPSILSEGEARARGYKCNTNEANYRPLKVYRWPEKGERLGIACDVGGGLLTTKGGDYSTIGVASANAFGPNELLMVWKGLIRPVAFAILASTLAWFCREKVGDECPPLLAPEWNGQGVPMNTTIDDYHLYDPHFKYFMPGVKGTPPSHHVGWESNGKTKPMAVGYLQDMIERGDFDIPDAACILELSSYKKYAGVGGDEFGGEGSHDDLVVVLYILAALIRGNRIAGIPQAAEIMRAGSASEDGGAEAFDPFAKEARGLYAGDDDDSLDGGEMDWE